MKLLETQKLSYFCGKKCLLQDITFSCSSGERIALQGRSGSGKSCFLALLCGLAKPSSGRILHQIKMCSCLRDRKAIGYIPQEDFFLGNESILFNAMLAVDLSHQKRQKTIQENVIEWLRFLDLPLEGFPYELSGGEKRRLSIIRALALKPIILLADEWTSGLDPSNQAKIWALFEKCSTVICVTHDPKVVAKCHQTYCMEKGILTAS